MIQMLPILFAAALTLDPPFTDHAVLQRDKPVVVRGSADAGAAVTVSFAGNTAKGVADAQGRWLVKLPAMPASKEPRDLAVAAQSNNRTIQNQTIHDVLVGEVWLASGQSNMEMPLWHPTRKRFRDKMGGLIRQFPPPANFRVMMTWPERGVSATPRRDYPVAWTVPDEAWLSTNKFSACAYYFGRELMTTLDVPVGVIAAFWGGTQIGSWVPDCGWESVKSEPYVATNILESVAKRVALETGGKRRGWPGYPGDLWNEQVAVFAPYTVRGLIWYQGESNIDENFFGRLAYSKNMRALMDGWRREFGCPDMKLLFVELAPFFYPWLKLPPDDDRLARLCDEQQRFAAEEPGAHLACISDVGDVNDIHPCRKWEVGTRLAALAFQHVYGLPVRADPPRAVAARLVAPGKVEISLKNAQGLYRWMPEVSLWTTNQHEVSPIRFIGRDGRIVDCESTITNGMIVVESVQMKDPAEVAYLRRCTDESNIYNDSALPLGTFKLKVDAEDRTFGDGEKVCFFGDSITHGGFYHKFVTDYYLTRFPGRNIRFRNVGVSGDTAGGARTRYEANIRANNPTAVSFFFGMNDKGSGIYTAPLTDQKIREQESRRTAYTTNMLDLVARVKRDFPKASLYFCTPTPFDDTVVFPGQEGPCARLGEKAALKGYAELVRSWCAKEGGTLVDLSATLNAFNDRKQRNDPSYTIIGKDRVHPGKPGHFLILQEFLRAQGAPGLVSSVDVDARTGKVRAENAAVTDFAAADGSCSFTVTEGALPYPVDAACGEIAVETDFDGCFNREFLCVTGLVEETRYALKIDGGEVCRRTGREFAAGLNLATFRMTPMYRQALAVAEVTERKRVTEQRLVCDLYFVRLWCQWMKFDPEDFAFLAKWYDDCKTKTNFCESKVPTYLKGWKDRDKSAAALERLDEEMWSARRISPHRFEIVPVVGNVIRFEDGEGVFAEMEAPDASAVDLKVHRQGAFTVLTVAPAKGAAREIRELKLPEIRLMRGIPDARTLGSGGLKRLGEDVGSYTFLAVAEPRTRKGVVAAFLTGRKGSGVVFSENRGGRAILKPVIQYGRLRLDSGESCAGETLLIGDFDDCRDGLERYADFVADYYGVKLPKQISGYCTWYSDKFGAAGTEKSTEEFAAVAAKNLVPWGLSFFQVDDRWQGGIVTNCLRRDFRTVRADGPYSSGLAKTASNLRAKGVRTGLWFLPFCGSQGDPAFADKKDLFVRSRLTTRRSRERDAKSRDGVDWLYPEMDNDANAPYECFWGGTAIDYTNPKSANYLRDLVRRFRDEWGVSYLKFDALFGAVATLHMYPSDEYRADDLGEQIFHDPKATNMENARKALETLRAAAGKDMFLLGCNLSQSMRTMVSAYGIVDAMRVGPDNSPMWDGIKAGPVRGTSRYFLNGRVWYNDPDPVYVRNKIPSSHARVSATWASMSGDLFAFSDWLPDLSDERVNILRRTIAPHRRPTKVRPVDLFESELANTWLLADGDSRIFGFFNWDEKKPLTVNYEAKYAGLDPEATYVGFDFWGNKFIAPFKGMVRADVGAGDAKVWQLREFNGTRPVLVSTSRHIASPLFEVTDETWDASARTLSGSSEVVANDPYELRIVLPGGLAVESAEIAGAKAEIRSDGVCARIRANPIGSGAVNWKVKVVTK